MNGKALVSTSIFAILSFIGAIYAMSNHDHNEQIKELNISLSNHQKNENYRLIVDNWNHCNEVDRETNIDVRIKQSSDEKEDFKLYYQWNYGSKHEFICNNSEYGCHFNEKAPYEPGLHYLTFYANNSQKEINKTIEIYVDLYVDITEKPKDKYNPGEFVNFAGYIYFCHNCKGKYADVYLKYEQQHEKHYSVVKCGSSGDFLMASIQIPPDESPGTKTIGIFIPNYGIVSSIKDITFEVSGPKTPSPSSIITMTPSPSKTPATSTPLMTPTQSPAKTTYTYIPTIQPTPSITSRPTAYPTTQPTPSTTSSPTTYPTPQPTQSTTLSPTTYPSIIPTTSEYPTTEVTTAMPTEIPAPSTTADTDSSQGGNSNKEKQKRYALIGIITAIAVLVVIIVIILIIYYRSRNQDYDPQEDVESREPEVVIPARDYYTHDNPLYSGDNQQITPCVSQCETSQPESDINVFGM